MNEQINIKDISYTNNSKIKVRKKRLISKLSDKKLKYTKNGICDMYIKYGKPSIDDVINDIENSNRKKQNRLLELLSRLNELELNYDNNNSYFRDYVNRGGDIEYAIDEGIMEWFYKNFTNYEDLLCKYKDEDRAIFLSKINKSKIKEINKSEQVFKLKLKKKLKVKNKNFEEKICIF